MTRVVRLGAAVLVGVQACAVAVDVVPVEGARELSFVGWPDASAREIRVRVLSALAQLRGEPFAEGLEVRAHGVPPEWLGGGELDLAVAVGVLAALGELDVSQLSGVGLVGSLGLDGRLVPVRGAFVLGEGLSGAGARWLLGAEANREELAAVGVRAGGLATLADVRSVLRGELRLADRDLWAPELRAAEGLGPGLRDALRAVDAGVRVLALEGPVSTSPTLLARQLCQRLPPMNFGERREVLAIQSASGLYLPGVGSALLRPFRAPHHSVSEAGLVGGGAKLRAGELTLAHRGVLYLDQLGEFSGRALEALAEGLRRGEIVVERHGRSLRLPARPCLVVASLSVCPCGASRAKCQCTAEQRQRHRRRDYGRFGELIECVVRLGSEHCEPYAHGDAEATLELHRRTHAITVEGSES